MSVHPVPLHAAKTPALPPRSLQARTLRAIAGFEAAKGLAALASAVGVLSLLHHDLHHLALELIGHFGLDPAQHYPALLLHYADLLNGTPIRSIVLLSSGYVLVRLAEAYGLWNDLAWGEWLGALSGALYVPFEFRHLLHRTTFVSFAVLALNMAMVIFLTVRLRRRRASKSDRLGE